jgi:hypothetical protein
VTDTFTCPFCHLRFSLRTEFQDHLRREHPERYRPAEGERRETDDEGRE